MANVNAQSLQREEKTFEGFLDAMVNKVNEVKTAVSNFILKLEHEHETLNWPSVLDSFALLSGQINSLLRCIKNEKNTVLRNLIALPLMLCPDRDEELSKITENRVPAFSHEVVPDYLRTKPDPEVEAKEQQIVARASAVSYDTGVRQINAVNKITNNVNDIINSHKEEWESEAGSRTNAAQTYTIADTYTIISAVCFGKGLKQVKPPGPPPNQPSVPKPMPTVQTGNMNKAPSSIKTTIKAGNNVHPYGR
ncbi:Mediator of RNA polymerase II transcription subunit 8 [Nymphon striatum]|nr:Mediator of RNA polymerase II transcription subunit 8 [Nymphon striatum]